MLTLSILTFYNYQYSRANRQLKSSCGSKKFLRRTASSSITHLGQSMYISSNNIGKYRSYVYIGEI